MLSAALMPWDLDGQVFNFTRYQLAVHPIAGGLARVIIAGSRRFDGVEIGRRYGSNLVRRAIAESGWAARQEIGCVIHGAALGIDRCAGAVCAGVYPVVSFPVRKIEWETFPGVAGHLRNAKMAENADRLILIWDGRSGGSKKMLEIAQRKGLLIHQLVITPAATSARG